MQLTSSRCQSVVYRVKGSLLAILGYTVLEFQITRYVSGRFGGNDAKVANVPPMYVRPC